MRQRNEKKRMHTPHHRPGRPSDRPARNLLSGSLTAACAAMGGAALLLFLLCGICLSCENPMQYAAPGAYVILILGACGAGVTAAALTRSRGLLSGTAAGLWYIGILFLLRLALPVSGHGAELDTVKILFLCAGAVGAAALCGYPVTHRAPKMRRPRGY